MIRIAHPTAALALAILLIGCSALAPRTSGQRSNARGSLQDGARSIDDLVQHFVLAIRQNDEGALRNLRVNEEEYRDVILPGSAAPGEPPRAYAPDLVEFLWGSLDVKNRYGERDLLKAYGGRMLTLEKSSFQRGVREYAGYTAHRRLALTLLDEQRKEVRFEVGSVAQVGDRYKFISFMRD
jgi:hypothetical protein